MYNRNGESFLSQNNSLSSCSVLALILHILTICLVAAIHMYQSLDRCGQMALTTNLQKQLLGLCSNHSTAACEVSGLDCSAVALKLFEAIRKTSDVSGIEDSIALMNTLAIHNKHER